MTFQPSNRLPVGYINGYHELDNHFSIRVNYNEYWITITKGKYSEYDNNFDYMIEFKFSENVSTVEDVNEKCYKIYNGNVSNTIIDTTQYTIDSFINNMISRDIIKRKNILLFIREFIPVLDSDYLFGSRFHNHLDTFYKMHCVKTCCYNHNFTVEPCIYGTKHFTIFKNFYEIGAYDFHYDYKIVFDFDNEITFNIRLGWVVGENELEYILKQKIYTFINSNVGQTITNSGDIYSFVFELIPLLENY